MSELTGLETADWGARARTVGVGISLTVAGFVGAYAVIFAGVSLLSAFGIDLQNRPALLFPVGTVFQGVGFGIAILGYVVYREEWDLIKVGVPDRWDVAWTVAGVVGLLASLAALSWVFGQFGIEVAQNQVERIGMQHPEMLLYMIPLAYLVIGPGEELLFRGAIQGVLRRAYAPVPAIVIASALFGVAHTMALAGTGKLAYVAAAAILGTILGIVYEVTDNVVVPALVHGTYDAVIFIAIYARATGMGGA